MTLSYFRDAVTKELQDRVDKAAQRAINMRAHAGITTDEYALMQVDTLAEARAYAEAARVVIAEYKKMTEAAPTQGDVAEDNQQRKEEAAYG